MVKMSTKGQLVVPDEIRKSLKMGPGDRFMPFAIKDGVVFKKVKLPDPKKEFASLASDLAKQMKKRNISSRDIKEAITWARSS